MLAVDKKGIALSEDRGSFKNAGCAGRPVFNHTSSMLYDSLMIRFVECDL